MTLFPLEADCRQAAARRSKQEEVGSPAGRCRYLTERRISEGDLDEGGALAPVWQIHCHTTNEKRKLSFSLKHSRRWWATLRNPPVGYEDRRKDVLECGSHHHEGQRLLGIQCLLVRKIVFSGLRTDTSSMNNRRDLTRARCELTTRNNIIVRF